MADKKTEKNKQEESKKEECIFCKIASGEIPSDKIADEENFIVIKDIHPVSEGHCLVIPKKHYKTVLDMPSSLGGELINIAKKQGLRLIQEKKADGFKIVQSNFKAAGQVVNHVHFHVIPYKEGKKVGRV